VQPCTTLTARCGAAAKSACYALHAFSGRLQPGASRCVLPSGRLYPRSERHYFSSEAGVASQPCEEGKIQCKGWWRGRFAHLPPWPPASALAIACSPLLRARLPASFRPCRPLLPLSLADERVFAWPAPRKEGMRSRGSAAASRSTLALSAKREEKAKGHVTSRPPILTSRPPRSAKVACPAASPPNRGGLLH